MQIMILILYAQSKKGQQFTSSNKTGHCWKNQMWILMKWETLEFIGTLLQVKLQEGMN